MGTDAVGKWRKQAFAKIISQYKRFYIELQQGTLIGESLRHTAVLVSLSVKLFKSEKKTHFPQIPLANEDLTQLANDSFTKNRT